MTISRQERAEIVDVAKLERAFELYEYLWDRAQAIVKTEIEYDTDLLGLQPNQRDALTWKRVPGPHPELGVVAGELIHDVRSSLDHLVSELRIEKGLRVSRASGFPIYKDEGLWKRNVLGESTDPCRGPNPLEGLSGGQVNAIRGYQPFADGELNRPFEILHAMSNMDKHRTLHTCGVMIHEPECVDYDPAGYYEVSDSRFNLGAGVIQVGGEFGWIGRRTISSPPLGTTVKVHLRGPASLAFVVDGERPMVSVQGLGRIVNAAFDAHAKLSPSSSLREVGRD